jgi:ATP-dependent helicase/nuclease subunit A
VAKTFSIYRSSAGSGKTRTLAKEYLKLALKFKADYFKYILAVTFTNKASQEMKDRILDYLDKFAKGEKDELAEELKKETGLDDQTFQQYSQAVQAEILHKYSHFSISTIDAFFQKVIRSFTREAGLVGDYRLEVETDAVVEEVIDNLIDELGSNKELTDWVVEFAKENLENERAWDVRFNLIEFAKEIFREEFKAIEDNVNKTTSARGFFKSLRESLWKQKNFFLSKVAKPASEILDDIEKNNWTADDFYFGKGSGLFTLLRNFKEEKNVSKIKPPGERVKNHFNAGGAWPGKKTLHAREIHKLSTEKFAPLLADILQSYDSMYAKALSAELALKNLYVFGLITDISRKLKEYKDENNVMLLADAPKFLNGVIQDSDTPFIYEKVGSFYRNYLIDEFQDTSGMQWKNFQPLIINSLDQGYPSLVVGDVKQAIYRWRGGDLNLLQQGIVPVIGEERVNAQELDRNFRSATQIVNFNNEVFSSAASVVATETGTTLSADTYHDIQQKNFLSESGFVHLEFLKEPTVEEKQLFSIDEDDDSDTPSKWQGIALEELARSLERLQQAGASLKDIAILVRKNEEGQRIANHLLQYKNSVNAKDGCYYDVVSNESLRIDGASSVNLLLGAMRYLLNGEDSVARAQLGYEFARLHEPMRELPEVFTVTNQSIFENNLPEAFKYQKASLKKLPLIELTETLIEIFEIGKNTGELVYLQAFQDLVLEFYNRERNDLGAFLEWWEANSYKKSVQISGEVNAAQILTVHKSKGLQFKYVIIPFCAWYMDHEPFKAPNLWVASNESPFDTAGFIPVRYQQSLKQTFFAEQYNEERTRSYLDNLNLLYVAFTRAEFGLIVTAPHPGVRGTKGTVAALLYNSIQNNLTLKSSWNEGSSVFRSGDWLTKIEQPNGPDNSVQLREYYSSSWRDKLVIKQSGSTFFEQSSSGVREKINYGIHMHTVLARMKYADDLADTIDAISLEGLITHQEKSGIHQALKDLLLISHVSEWFSKSWEVKTEVPILLPGGKENRLDRLIYKNKKAIVIDFKTGEAKRNDNEQVLEYMEILRQMNFTDVQGFLLYIREKEVVEVKSGSKPKALKKVPDRDQLSLGF